MKHPTPKPTPLKRDHRERLLREGKRQFYANGFHGTTVDALLAAADAPKGSFYHHFGSKDAFTTEVVARYNAATLEALARFAALPHAHGRAKLQAYFHDLATRFAAGDNRVGCLVGKFSTELAPSSEFFGDLLADSMDQWRRAIAAIVHEGQKDGSIRKDLTAATLSHLLLSLLQGAVTISLAHRTSDTMVEIEKAIPKLLKPSA